MTTEYQLLIWSMIVSGIIAVPLSRWGPRKFKRFGLVVWGNMLWAYLEAYLLWAGTTHLSWCLGVLVVFIGWSCYAGTKRLSTGTGTYSPEAKNHPWVFVITSIVMVTVTCLLVWGAS